MTGTDRQAERRRPVDPAKLIAALRQAWETPQAVVRSFGSGKHGVTVLANSSFDQQPLPGVDNPYWEVVRWIPAEPPLWGRGAPEPEIIPHAFADDVYQELVELGAERTRLCMQYAWSIPSPDDVRWMLAQLDGRTVVEVGAGTGYWAWQLEQAGVDVAAYDPAPPGPGNSWCSGGPYTTVLAEGAEAAAAHADRALLMVWPPYDGAHARHALSVYKGDLLLYAGEGHGGCTADDDFYELLDAEWEEIDTAPRHVTWWGIHCALTAYRRKA